MIKGKVLSVWEVLAELQTIFLSWKDISLKQQRCIPNVLKTGFAQKFGSKIQDSFHTFFPKQ